jgi:hypothetical protein
MIPTQINLNLPADAVILQRYLLNVFYENNYIDRRDQLIVLYDDVANWDADKVDEFSRYLLGSFPFVDEDYNVQYLYWDFIQSCESYDINFIWNRVESLDTPWKDFYRTTFIFWKAIELWTTINRILYYNEHISPDANMYYYIDTCRIRNDIADLTWNNVLLILKEKCSQLESQTDDSLNKYITQNIYDFNVSHDTVRLINNYASCVYYVQTLTDNA